MRAPPHEWAHISPRFLDSHRSPSCSHSSLLSQLQVYSSPLGPDPHFLNCSNTSPRSQEADDMSRELGLPYVITVQGHTGGHGSVSLRSDHGSDLWLMSTGPALLSRINCRVSSEGPPLMYGFLPETEHSGVLKGASLAIYCNRTVAYYTFRRPDQQPACSRLGSGQHQPLAGLSASPGSCLSFSSTLLHCFS